MKKEPVPKLIKEERMKERQNWVDIYEAKAKDYSSCHYLMKLGSDKIDIKAEFVKKLHDDLCKANRKELKAA